MFGLWIPVAPNGPCEREALLLFCLSHCVQRRVKDRDARHMDKARFIARVREAKLARGDTIQVVDEDSDRNEYLAPLRVWPTSFAHLDAAQRWNEERTVLRAIASFLFMFLAPEWGSDDRTRSPTFNPVCMLRVCGKSWYDRLPAMCCCDCGCSSRPGDFRSEWSFHRSGNHGRVPCRACWDLHLGDHLACIRCTREHWAFSSGDSS